MQKLNMSEGEMWQEQFDYLITPKIDQMSKNKQAKLDIIDMGPHVFLSSNIDISILY
jgi:hypothetical protein